MKNRLIILIAVIGLCARSLAGEITLLWNQNPEENITGYKVYYAPQDGTLPVSAIDVGIPALFPITTQDGATISDYTFTVRSLRVGQRYWFAVTAYDTEGEESELSDKAFGKVRLTKPKMLRIPVSLQKATSLNGEWKTFATVMVETAEPNLFFRAAIPPLARVE